MTGRILAFLLFLTIFLAACLGGSHEGQISVETNESAYVLVKTSEFDKLVEKLDAPQLIDVRTDGECAQGMIPNASQIDFSSKTFKEEVAKLDKAKPVVVYCAVGGRSKRAARMMVDMGFEKVYDLSGGYRQWSQVQQTAAEAKFTH